VLPIIGRMRIGPGTRRAALLALAPLAVALALPAGAAAAAAATKPATPELIEQAQQRGEVDGARATQLRAYALAAPEKLPSRYRSKAPWDGTLTLRRIHRALPKLPASRAKSETAALAGPSAQAVTSCASESSGDLPNETTTANLYIQYDGATLDPSLTISQYATSLQGAWDKEVTTFGWAAPPVKLGSAAPGNRYPVRVDDLGGGLYGYVSPGGTYAGFVGNNPNTSWNDQDAYATCMVLSQDYTGFPSSPQNSLDSTTAHEFNHSIQFGYGALTGSGAADNTFAEGGATWMEDEVYDSSNDNYNYLWPDFRQPMGEYDSSFAYPYWIVFRALSEHYGTGTAASGEQLMQDFWEATSKGTGNNLTAMEQAEVLSGTTLPDAYHAAAIALKFSKDCGGAYVYPYCFEEGTQYGSIRPAERAAHRVISTVGLDAVDTASDRYALQWTALPTTGGPYDVSMANTSPGGTLKGSVVCDTGAALLPSPLPSPAVGSGQSSTVEDFDPTGCTQVVLVTTNSAHAVANPAGELPRAMQVSTQPASAAEQDNLTVVKTGTGSGSVTSSPSGINCGSDCFQRYAAGEEVELTATPDSGSTFSGWGGACAGAGTCSVSMDASRSVTATFAPGSVSGPPATPAAPATSPPSGTSMLDSLAPALSSLKLSAGRFRALPARGRKPPVGSRLRYSLSEAAKVGFRVERALSGRRVGSSCRKPSASNLHRARCTRWVRAGSFTKTGRSGSNSFVFSGRLGGRKLKAGSYRFVVVARDSAANASVARRKTFRILR
jgi:hypothetical protein